MTPSALDIRLFKRDIALDGPPVDGDWPTIAGRPNVLGAQARRAVSARGRLLHRPAYGGGLTHQIERISGATIAAYLAGTLRVNAERDPRVSAVDVSVTHEGPRTVATLIVYTPGEGTPGTVTFDLSAN